MKTTRTQENKARAVELIEAINTRKAAKKREDQLKDQFKSLMGDEFALTVEGVAVITLEEKARSFLNQKDLAADYGQDFLDSYKDVTAYQQMNILSIG